MKYLTLLRTTRTCFLGMLFVLSVIGVTYAGSYDPVGEAVTKLVQYCNEPKGNVDERAAAVLVDYVTGPKQSREAPLSKLMDSTGAYFEFDMKVPFARFIEYSYNPSIPPVITRPSSLRYSIWSPTQGETRRLTGKWKPVVPGGAPVVIHGVQRESDTPDLNTGVYHEYTLKRTLIVFNHKGRQALVSVSKQIGQSNVGKKGAILGKDSSWSYYYSGEPGTPKTGLGWVKSYIYEFFSVGVYVESGPSVRTGVFQWLRAGWSGINFVKPSHILAGMKLRFARDCKVSLESPMLPTPGQIASVYQWLSGMQPADLKGKYTALQEGLKLTAIKDGHIGAADEDERLSYANTPKEQMLQELMLEYLKVSLGKPTILGKHAFSTAPAPIIESREMYQREMP